MRAKTCDGCRAYRPGSNWGAGYACSLHYRQTMQNGEVKPVGHCDKPRTIKLLVYLLGMQRDSSLTRPAVDSPLTP